MKKRFGKLISALLCATVAVSLVAGCGAGSKKSTDGTTASKTADGKLAVSVCGGSEDSMNINTAKTDTLLGLSASRHLYEGLYKLDKDGKVVFGQASDVKVSDDGLTYTFTLRDGITWSDGVAVKASDFVYGWQYLKDSAGSYCSLLSMVSDAKATDDKTLVVTLSYPCTYLPSVLAFPSAYPVRQDIVEKNGESYATDPDKAVYNGPYALTKWTHQESMVMTARKDYYDYNSISVGELTWMLMSDQSTMLASFKSGDLVYSDSYPEQEAASLKDNGLHFTSGFNNYCTMFNVGEKGPEVLKDVKVRKALSLAIDRQNIIKIRGLADEVGTSYTPSGLTNAAGQDFTSTVTKWFDPDTYDKNCEEAKQLLADAGYANGQGFPTLTYIVGNEDRKAIAETIVNDWKTVLGINSVTVEVVDSFYAQRSDMDYDIAYFGWFMDYPDISNMLYTMTTDSKNDAGYSNPAYDKAYAAATAATDEATQWKNYAECEKVLSEDVPVAPILHSQNSYLFDDKNYNGLVYYCGNYYFGYITKK